MSLFYLGFGNSSSFMLFYITWLCFGRLKFIPLHACNTIGVSSLILHNWHLISRNDFEFTVFYKFRHVSSIFGPKRMGFVGLNLSFEAWTSIWKFHNSASSLERPNVGSSIKFILLEVLQNFEDHTSDQSCARVRTVFTQSCARETV